MVPSTGSTQFHSFVMDAIPANSWDSYWFSPTTLPCRAPFRSFAGGRAASVGRSRLRDGRGWSRRRAGGPCPRGSGSAPAPPRRPPPPATLARFGPPSLRPFQHRRRRAQRIAPAREMGARARRESDAGGSASDSRPGRRRPFARGPRPAARDGLGRPPPRRSSPSAGRRAAPHDASRPEPPLAPSAPWKKARRKPPVDQEIGNRPRNRLNKLVASMRPIGGCSIKRPPKRLGQFVPAERFVEYYTPGRKNAARLDRLR